MTIRMVSGLSWSRLMLEIQSGLNDERVDSIVIHKPGSRWKNADGGETFVDARGEFHRVEELTPVGGC